MSNVTCNSEWTWVFAKALPLAYGHYLAGTLDKVITLKSADPFFYFLDQSKFEPISKIGSDGFDSNSYNFSFDPKSAWGDIWTKPKIKEYYQTNYKINSDKEILVINNKFIEEWGKPCINYLNENELKCIFDLLSEKYQIYYIRYNGNNTTSEEYFDEQEVIRAGVKTPKGDIGTSFLDYELINEYSNIRTVYDVMEMYQCGFNTAQCIILANSNKHISVSGGTAVLSSLFEGDNIIYNPDRPGNKNLERGVWKTNSWLSKLSNANIYGTINQQELLTLINKIY